MRIASLSAEQALVALNLALALNLGVILMTSDSGAAPATSPEATAAQPAGPRKLLVLARDSPTDAAVGQPVAEVSGAEVLAVPTTGLTAAMRAELSRSRPDQVLILGGPAAVTEATASALRQHTSGTVTRISGPDRFVTAAKVATSQFSSPVPRVRIVSDDEVGAIPLAQRRPGSVAPVLLVRRDSIPADTAAALQELRPRTISVLGGPGAVSAAVLQQLRGYTPGQVVQRW